MRNIYDNSEFFAAYAEMGRSKDGLKAAGEWHQLQPLFPKLQGKKVFGFNIRLSPQVLMRIGFMMKMGNLNIGQSTITITRAKEKPIFLVNE